MSRVALYAAGGARRDVNVADVLTPESRDEVRADANSLVKQLRLVAYGSDTMRSRFMFRGDSLWWFTELYLHKTKHLERAIATVRALDAAAEGHAPARLEVTADDWVVAAAARALGEARAVPVEVTGAPAPASHAWRSFLIQATASIGRLRPGRRLPRAAPPRVAAFVHTAFAEDATGTEGVPAERYVGPVLDAVASRLPPGGLRAIGVGPRRNFRARRWWDPILGSPPPRAVTPIEWLASSRALTASRAFWRTRGALAEAIVSGPSVREAARYRGVDLWPVLAEDLRGAALLQWPWSTRAMDEAAAALDLLEPAVAVTYAEAGGWGRALVLEARRRGVPSIGLQHGFIYRHWLNYLHEPDEMTGGDGGFPFPTRTLVFDAFTAEHLQRAGRFPPDALAVTGSPQRDHLAAHAAAVSDEERRDIRRGFGARSDQPVAVLVAKASELSAELPALAHAVAGRPDVRLVVKPHPAETADAYAVLARLANVAIAPPDTTLTRVLAAADALVTQNSTVAVDALALGLPAIVVGLPNNLSPFVDAGAMIGADAAGLAGALEAVLYDRAARERLSTQARAYAERAGMRADGHAVTRAAEAILAASA